MTKRLKIAFALWTISALSLLGSISSGKVAQVAPGAVVLIAIGAYFYFTKNKIVVKNKVSESASIAYSFDNLPSNEPDDIDIERTINVDPVDNIQSLLKRYRRGDKWNGYSLKEAEQEILEGGEEFLFEYEPWTVSAVIPLPEGVNFKDRNNEGFLSDYEEFNVYVDSDDYSGRFLLGVTDRLYSDDIKTLLIKDGAVPVCVDVFGGKCMYRSSITKNIDIHESDYQFTFSI